MSRKKYTRYSREFKLEAIRLADESGKPVTQVARELGLRVNQIYKWKKQLEVKQDKVVTDPDKAADQAAEIRRLKKELEAVCEENEFLKKTAIFFAKQRP
jgi:transposase